LPYEVHEKVFEFVLKLVAERGLVKGERIGVDTSTMEANSALRSIVRRDSGDTYREMLTRIPSRATALFLGHAKSSFWLPLWIRGPGEELRVALSIPLP
jgi:hypothetical protein